MGDLVADLIELLQVMINHHLEMDKEGVEGEAEAEEEEVHHEENVTDAIKKDTLYVIVQNLHQITTIMLHLLLKVVVLVNQVLVDLVVDLVEHPQVMINHHLEMDKEGVEGE